jgi:hypothetical protein
MGIDGPHFWFCYAKREYNTLKKHDPADTLFEMLEWWGAPLRNEDCKIKKLS